MLQIGPSFSWRHSFSTERSVDDRYIVFLLLEGLLLAYNIGSLSTHKNRNLNQISGLHFCVETVLQRDARLMNGPWIPLGLTNVPNRRCIPLGLTILPDGQSSPRGPTRKLTCTRSLPMPAPLAFGSARLDENG